MAVSDSREAAKHANMKSNGMAARLGPRQRLDA